MNPTVNTTRVDWDLSRISHDKFDAFCHSRQLRPTFSSNLFSHPKICFELGAGSGWFFTRLARIFPDTRFVAIERSRWRGQRLVHRVERTNLPNIFGYRGNAITAVICEIPPATLERIYILYPCPWPRTSQRTNRWYLHPIMRHLARCLKPGGYLVWASDQSFYIEEARYVCEQRFDFISLACGPLSANPYNDLEKFPSGRTKFEASFLSNQTPCYELICQKNFENSTAVQPQTRALLEANGVTKSTQAKF